MEIFSKYGGSVLSVDEAAKVLEGEWNYMRTVLLEFPSEDGQWHGITRRNIRASRSTGLLLRMRTSS